MSKDNLNKMLLSGAAVSSFVLFLNKDKIKNKSDMYFEKISNASGVPVDKIKQRLKPNTWNNIEQLTSIVAILIAEYAVNEKTIKYDKVAKGIVKWTIYIGEKSNTIYNKKEVKQLLEVVDSPAVVEEIQKFLSLPNDLKKLAKTSKLSKDKNLGNIIKYKLLSAINEEFSKIKIVKPKRKIAKKVTKKI